MQEQHARGVQHPDSVRKLQQKADAREKATQASPGGGGLRVGFRMWIISSSLLITSTLLCIRHL